MSGLKQLGMRRGSCQAAWLLSGCALLAGQHASAAAAEPGTPAAASTGPRSTVTHIATLIEDNYFDAAKGRAIAERLRSATQAGEFDPLRQPRELAAALTSLLHPLDHHFRVIYAGDSAAHEPNSSSEPIDPTVMERRGAYGFRRVEMLPGAIGYIELQFFAELAAGKSDDPARAAVNAALQLVADANAIIIDLRDNVGGSSDMAAYLVSAFTPAGANIYDVVHWRNGSDSERPALPYPQPRLNVPLYLLISARTASAAEVAAYTLHASGRAVIVGQTSAGAANPGGAFPLENGLSVFIPIGTPINPVTGGNWEAKGIVPDFPIAAQAALPYAERLALQSVLDRNPDAPQAGYVRQTLEALRAQASHRTGAPLRSYEGMYSGIRITAAGDQLVLRQADRIPQPLVRLNEDTFFDQDDPSRQVTFERNGNGTIRGLRLIYANGHELWFPARASSLPPLQ